MTNSYLPAQPPWPTAYPRFVLESLPGEKPVEAAERHVAEAKCLRSHAMFQPDPCARRTADAYLASAQAELKAQRSRCALQIPIRLSARRAPSARSALRRVGMAGAPSR